MKIKVYFLLTIIVIYYSKTYGQDNGVLSIKVIKTTSAQSFGGYSLILDLDKSGNIVGTNLHKGLDPRDFFDKSGKNIVETDFHKGLEESPIKLNEPEEGYCYIIVYFKAVHRILVDRDVRLVSCNDTLIPRLPFHSKKNQTPSTVYDFGPWGELVVDVSKYEKYMYDMGFTYGNPRDELIFLFTISKKCISDSKFFIGKDEYNISGTYVPH